MTVAEALRAAALRIERRDAEVLLCASLSCNRAHLIAHASETLDQASTRNFQAWVDRRALGEPVAYLTGRREFYGREFLVGPEVLIPRPETEHLVEQALARLPSQQWPEDPAHASVLDLGTGSGAIAITLALERPALAVTACDVSQGAIMLASKNASQLDAKVEFVQSDWYSALPGRRFDLIASNPPYVAALDPHLGQGDLRFEPRGALTDNSADGLSSLRQIASGATLHLHPGGWLLLEHGYDQADAVQGILLQSGFEDLICIHDLAGIPRVAGGRLG